MKNGVKWFDTNGNPIHAHGGWILKFNGWFYWYGENRTSDNLVSCYKTRDFKEFQFCNNVLTAKSKTENIGISNDISLLNGKELFEGIYQHGTLRMIDDRVLINIERPKVVYCEKTKKFVMWMHYENGWNYKAAACAVATCDTPDGDFVYHGYFNPFGNMSRDCTIFKIGEKTYFSSAARDNRDLHIYLMNEDCLSLNKQINILFADCSREAPSFFVKGGRLFVLTSACTGWMANQGTFSYASIENFDKKWSPLQSFGDETTYQSQPAFVFENDGRYYYFGDRWGNTSEEYFDSTYVVLEIQFDENGNPFIEYSENAQFPNII